MSGKLIPVDLDAMDAKAPQRPGGFLFSQRERARKAAMDAHERYPQECEEWSARGSVAVPEYWGFVVNAALDALEPKRSAPESFEDSVALDNGGHGR